MLTQETGRCVEDPVSPQQEKERQQTRDDALFVFLRRMRVTPRTLSDLARHRSFFGLAWLCVHLFAKSEELGKVSIDPPGSIDVSGTQGLSPKKILLFLESLPSSVEEIKIDSVAMKEAALPLFVRFLERRKAVRETAEGKETPRMKSFVFAEKSLGGHQALQIFGLLLPSLEILCLKGNTLGNKGIRALADAVRSGGASSLRELDLERTGLNESGLELLCGAIKESSLRVEKLNLSGNRCLPHKAKLLCSILSVESLPFLRELGLRECGLMDTQLIRVLTAIGNAKFSNFESLDLISDLGLGTKCSEVLEQIAKFLKSGALSSLKNFSLSTREGEDSAEGLSVLLGALKCRETSSLEKVKLHLAGSMKMEDVQALGRGEYPVVRTCSLVIPSTKLAAFLKGLLERVAVGEQREPFDDLDLMVRFNEFQVAKPTKVEQLGFLARAFQEGKLAGSCRSLGLSYLRSSDLQIVEAKTLVVRALILCKFPRLSVLSLHNFELTDADVCLLAEGVRAGYFSCLRELDLSEAINVGGEGIQRLMAAVVESETGGLEGLETLDVSGTRAGLGGESLGSALLAGKMGSLSEIKIGRAEMTDDAVRKIACAVRGGWVSGLVVLNMNENFAVGPDSWKYLMEGIDESEIGLPYLKSIGMKSTSVTVVGGSVVAVLTSESKKGLPSCIQSLSLSGSRMREESLAALAACGSGKLSSLEYLHLLDCDIDDVMLKRLGEIFAASSDSNLKGLDLQMNRITPEGLSSFFDILTTESLANVVKIHLGGQRDKIRLGEKGVGECGSSARSSVCDPTLTIASVLKAAHHQGKLPRLQISAYGSRHF
uniref:Uncharacterized protein n=1 Tax=Chromera velia CCMP2878 TaxID=1169474 RepID=A0A0G4HM52_9ALVE|eukprot:Cvel_7456.t1-p1 / transcript=Cvel_7456.t1 / gene=Cvel_7456 / organism=Chromera_velia_CCMP2878 / gene_product=hypothetical protein / transcript_product=hypothetical protein / location=Cvel_scaffold390:35445-40206(+) / protein_length=829 / sequence_SO=supercontig / SO=protein_coding / is_pseudo=false